MTSQDLIVHACCGISLVNNNIFYSLCLHVRAMAVILPFVFMSMTKFEDGPQQALSKYNNQQFTIIFYCVKHFFLIF